MHINHLGTVNSLSKNRDDLIGFIRNLNSMTYITISATQSHQTYHLSVESDSIVPLAQQQLEAIEEKLRSLGVSLNTD